MSYLNTEEERQKFRKLHILKEILLRFQKVKFKGLESIFTLIFQRDQKDIFVGLPTCVQDGIDELKVKCLILLYYDSD